MSAPGPPEAPLESARRELARRGYLGGGRPPARVSRLRPLAVAAAWAATLAAVAAVAAVVAAAAPAVLLAPTALAFLPVTLVLVVVGAGLGRLLAHGLLALGAEPGFVSALLGGAAGIAVALGVIALAGGPSADWPRWIAVILTALAVATRAAVAVRLALARRLALGRAEPGRATALPALLFAFSLGASALLVALGARSPAEPTPAAAAYPRPAGRVAVVAVDGLSREDLDAAAAGSGSLGRVAGWGWAPLVGAGGRLPAVVWTTVACGVEARRHGVEELEEVRLFGCRDGLALGTAARRALVAAWRPLGGVEVVARPALERLYPTFWEMASRAGCPVLVGGWWGSWPVRRVLGEVASERAWLGGATGTDAVTPGLAEVVEAAWRDTPDAATGSDRLALELVGRAVAAEGPQAVALALPALDVVQRRAAGGPPVALAAALAPHLDVLARAIAGLEAGGYRVWLVALPWRDGTPFVAASALPAGRHAEVDARALAGTWLAALGLPAPDDGQRPGAVPGRAGYGPPPPPLAAPPPAARAVQRELLRSLGYLQ